MSLCTVNVHFASVLIYYSCHYFITLILPFRLPTSSSLCLIPLLSFSPLSSKSHAGLSRSPERKKNESDSSSIGDTGQAYVVGQHAKNNITVFTNY